MKRYTVTGRPESITCCICSEQYTIILLSWMQDPKLLKAELLRRDSDGHSLLQLTAFGAAEGVVTEACRVQGFTEEEVRSRVPGKFGGVNMQHHFAADAVGGVLTLPYLFLSDRRNAPLFGRRNNGTGGGDSRRQQRKLRIDSQSPRD